MGRRREIVLEGVCSRRTYLIWICVIAVALLVLQLPYLFVTEPGSALFIVSAINVAGFVVFAVGSSAMVRYCKTHREERYGF